jgi:hypothetical protein
MTNNDNNLHITQFHIGDRSSTFKIIFSNMNERIQTLKLNYIHIYQSIYRFQLENNLERLHIQL